MDYFEKLFVDCIEQSKIETCLKLPDHCLFCGDSNYFHFQAYQNYDIYQCNTCGQEYKLMR